MQYTYIFYEYFVCLPQEGFYFTRFSKVFIAYQAIKPFIFIGILRRLVSHSIFVGDDVSMQLRKKIKFYKPLYKIHDVTQECVTI